jgi:multicomponent Na+:H+ antiporter subunit B
VNDPVLRTASRVIIPFAIVYGSYVTVYGHLSPGGGFPGGALLAAAVILYTLTWGEGRLSSSRSRHASERLESGALLVYVAIGVFGIVRGTPFLTNLGTGIPPGEMGTIISAGFIPIIGILIGLKVAGTVIRLFHAMLRDDDTGDRS